MVDTVHQRFTRVLFSRMNESIGSPVDHFKQSSLSQSFVAVFSQLASGVATHFFSHFAHCSNPRLSASFWRWSTHRKMAVQTLKYEQGQWREGWGTCVSFSTATAS